MGSGRLHYMRRPLHRGQAAPVQSLATTWKMPNVTGYPGPCPTHLHRRCTPKIATQHRRFYRKEKVVKLSAKGSGHKHSVN